MHLNLNSLNLLYFRNENFLFWTFFSVALYTSALNRFIHTLNCLLMALLADIVTLLFQLAMLDTEFFLINI